MEIYDLIKFQLDLFQGTEPEIEVRKRDRMSILILICNLFFRKAMQMCNAAQMSPPGYEMEAQQMRMRIQ